MLNIFKKEYKVVENRKNGTIITHYLCGKVEDVDKDVEMFKNNCSKYESFGKEGMIVWE